MISVSKFTAAFFAGYMLPGLAGALAAEPQTYVNARFSYAISVPEGYRVSAASENGDGQTMVSRDGTAQLAVWGAHITDGTFQSEIEDRIGWEKDDGWSVSYQRVQPEWASYSGSKGNRIFYTRSIPVCGRAQAAYFRIEYEKADRHLLDPIIKDLVASLHPTEGCN
jgi:hypothetical protein